MTTTPTTAHPNAPEPPGEPDFDRGLAVSKFMGKEFASISRTSILTGLVIQFGFTSLIIVPPTLFFILLKVAHAPFALALISSILIAIPAFWLGFTILTRLHNTSDAKPSNAQYLSNQTDTRFRVRAVLNPNRFNRGFRQWAEVTIGIPEKRKPPIDPQTLDAMVGGFEPIVVHPWFGLQRTRNYWLAVFVYTAATAAAIGYLLYTIHGSWTNIKNAGGMFAYGFIAASFFTGMIGAELSFPTYVRVAPGRLDIFRYSFLGRGQPAVRTYDLRSIGICVDFGSFLVALEPPRPPGTPLPEFIQSKRWPHTHSHPEGHVPDYLALTMCPGRTELCQRIVQAARTDEPTPELPNDRLTD